MEHTNGEVGDPNVPEAELLLPWYVTGKLDEADRRLVERHLAENPDVAAQVEIIRDEREATVAVNEAMAGAQAHALNRLFADISNEERANAAVAKTAPAHAGLGAWLRGLADRVAEWFGDLAPAPRAFAMASVLVLVLGQAVAIGVLVNQPGGTGGYVTATGQGPVSAQGSGTHLLVQFAPSAQLRDIAALLEPLGARIVNGPRAGGFFDVRVADKELEENEVARLIAQLQDQPELVLFVGRSN